MPHLLHKLRRGLEERHDVCKRGWGRGWVEWLAEVSGCGQGCEWDGGWGRGCSGSWWGQQLTAWPPHFGCMAARPQLQPGPTCWRGVGLEGGVEGEQANAHQRLPRGHCSKGPGHTDLQLMCSSKKRAEVTVQQGAGTKRECGKRACEAAHVAYCLRAVPEPSALLASGRRPDGRSAAQSASTSAATRGACPAAAALQEPFSRGLRGPPRAAGAHLVKQSKALAQRHVVLRHQPLQQLVICGGTTRRGAQRD